MDQKTEENGKMIPVLTVFKNGTHFKNIILSSPSDSETERNQEDVTLMVGRHPDCHIVLEHPSISRYHLQLKINESLKRLLVTDLSSVHGTMVSGRKINPQVSVQLDEGDLLKFGASTRMYKLKWVSSIFDLEKEEVNASSSVSKNQKDEGNGILGADKQDQWNASAPLMEPESACSSLPQRSPVNSTSEKENQVRQSSQTKENPGTMNLWHRRCGSSSAPRLRENIKSANGLEMGLSAKIKNLESEVAATIDQVKNETSMDIIASQEEEFDLGKNNSSIDEFIASNNLETKDRGCEDTTAVDVVSRAMTRLREQATLHDSSFNSFNEEEDILLPNDQSSSPQILQCISKSNLVEIKENEIDIFRGLQSDDDMTRKYNDPTTPDHGCGAKFERFHYNSGCRSVHEDTNSFSSEKVNLTPKTNNKSTSGCLAEGSKSTTSATAEQRFHYNSGYRSVLEETNSFSSEKVKLTPKTNNKATSGSSAEESKSKISETAKQGFHYNSGCRSVHEETNSFSSGKVKLTPKTNNKATSGCLAEERKSKISATAEEGTKQHQFPGSSLCAGVTKSDGEEIFPSDKENSPHQVPAHVPRSSSRRLDYGDLDDGRNIGTPLSVEQKSKRNRLSGSSPLARHCFAYSDTGYMFQADENLSSQAPTHVLKSRVKLTTENSTMEVHNCGKMATAKQDMKKFDWHGGSPSEDFSNSTVDEMFPSDKENVTPKFSRALKSKTKIPSKFKEEMIRQKRLEERVPFQNLLLSSPGDVKQSPSITASGTGNTVTCNASCSSVIQYVDQSAENLGAATKKKWYMVADTSCLLDAQSRRSLKLMEGLKGTQLIIPKMVVRELDSLKHRASRFRKETEASLIMQWIEECMVKISWWIHVQSSGECLPLSATPPVSPHSQPSQRGNESSGCNAASFATASQIPFSSYGSFAEIVSPTAEDHILECALLFKKLKTDGRLILLTKEVGLKIKAMAEGLICETPEAFCQSLVSPYSERFLWLESTPRGPTWSSLGDQCGLGGTHHHFPARTTLRKKVFAEGAKGLKLILRHNYHYGQMNLAA